MAEGEAAWKHSLICDNKAQTFQVDLKSTRKTHPELNEHVARPVWNDRVFERNTHVTLQPYAIQHTLAQLLNGYDETFLILTTN